MREREESVRENRDRKKRFEKGALCSREGESRRSRIIERTLGRCDCDGDGDGEIQKLEHGVSKLKLSFGERKERKTRRDNERTRNKLKGKLRKKKLLFYLFNLKNKNTSIPYYTMNKFTILDGEFENECCMW